MKQRPRTRALPLFARWMVRLEGALRPRRRALLALLLALLAADGARLVARDKLGDFTPLYRAAGRVGAGEPLYAERVTRDLRPYLYSPALALALAPLASLPLDAARALWYALSVAALALSFRLASRLVWGRAPPRPGFTALMALTPAAWMHNALEHGQATPLMLALVLASFSLRKRGREGAAGLLLAASLAIKPYPAVFLLQMLCCGAWRALGFALAFAALILAAPAAYFGPAYPEILRDWLRVIGELPAIDLTGSSSQSFAAFCARSFGEGAGAFGCSPASLCTLAGGAVTLGVAAWLAMRSRGEDASRFPGRSLVSLALLSIACAVLPPAGWKHGFALLLLPCAVLARLALEREGRLAAWALLASAALVALVHLRVPGAGRIFQDWSFVLWDGVLLYAALALYGARPARHS